MILRQQRFLPTSIPAILVIAAILLAGCNRPRFQQSPPLKPAADSAAAPGGIRFEVVSEAAGIHCRWPLQPRPIRILETMGGGCAFLDYDNDGWMDIFLTTRPRPTLYRNRGNGTFEDVTALVGLEKVTKGFWMGCAVGDYDGDGRPDILLTGYGHLALLKNEGGKGFRDVTAAAGLDPKDHGDWGLSAGFMDLDGSGRLSLVITHYVKFGPGDRDDCELVPGVVSGCPVNYYVPQYPELWQNMGNGRFQNITARAGMREKADTHGRSMAVAFADIDGNGRMDFYIGNDGYPAELMYNLGNSRFRNIGLQSGTAFASMGHPVASMGCDWGDYDRDGRPDLATSAFSDEPYSLFHNLGNRLFEYASDTTNLSGQTYRTLGFSAKWLDMDNDGWPDLAYANGHVYDNAELIDPLILFREPLQLFHNEPGPRGRQFHDLVPEMGGRIAEPIVGRGMATGDIDNDGRVDILVVDYEGETLLLHNVSETRNHWITLDLRSDGSNRFACGARVTARAGKRTWVADVSPASGFLSSSDPRIHFGLGDISRLESVEIRWPDGRREVLKSVPADQLLIITKGRGITGHAPKAGH
jgi:hypothetical protein